jgi:hypothetical protein
MKSLLVLLFVTTSALADDGALLHCRTIANPANRLSCYDALELAAPATPVRATGTAPAAGATPAEKATQEQSFGLEQRVKNRLDRIESTLVGGFEGWRPRQRFKLANGQVWLVNDDSDDTVARIDNPKVVIERGAMGAIHMGIEGSGKAVKVRRLQ